MFLFIVIKKLPPPNQHLDVGNSCLNFKPKMLNIPVGCVQRLDWCHLLKVDRGLTFDYKFVIKFHGACLCSCIHPGSTPAMKEIIRACSFCSGENSQLVLFFHLVFPILLLGFGCELKGQLMYRKPKRLLISLLILRSGMVLWYCLW